MANKQSDSRSRWRYNMIEARRSLGLRREDVARLTHYSIDTIQLLEYGLRYNGKWTKGRQCILEAMSKLYGKPVEWLDKLGKDGTI